MPPQAPREYDDILEKTARIVTSRREHVMLMEYSLPSAVSGLVLYVRFVGNITQVHTYTIKGF